MALTMSDRLLLFFFFFFSKISIANTIITFPSYKSNLYDGNVSRKAWVTQWGSRALLCKAIFFIIHFLNILRKFKQNFFFQNYEKLSGKF